MRKSPNRLPPIEVEDPPIKVNLTIPQSLQRTLESFKEYFTTTRGSSPSNDNAVIVGILTGYFRDQPAFQRWLKAKAEGESPAS
jgi:hypothetical protein